MARKLVVVHLGRNNVQRLQLTVDGAPADLAAVTRWLLYLAADLVIDSQVETEAFDVTEGDGILVLDLGTLAAPPAAGSYTGVRLVSIDPSNPDGIVWDDELHLRFK